MQDGAIMQVGFGAARVLAGGRPRDVPSASAYHLTVWGLTAWGIALVVAV